MEREQFTFYRSFLDGVSRIRKKTDRCDAYDAIVRYALSGEEPDLDGMADAAALAFVMARPNIDASRKKAEAGRKGGGIKSEATAKQPASKAEANADKVEARESRNQEKEQVKEQVKGQVKGQGQMSESRARGAAFDRFWAAYPRKVGKQDAARAFARVKAPVEQLIAAVEAQMQSQQWQREGGRYIPNPATWLNQGRWEDSLPAAQQDYGRAGEGFQHHGQAISPMMREAAQRLMDEEAAEAAEDTGGQRADVGIGPYGTVVSKGPMLALAPTGKEWIVCWNCHGGQRDRRRSASRRFGS